MAESSLATTEGSDICKFVENERVLLEKMRDDFKEKGKAGVWWDGKVSEEEKKVWWYLYLFTFKSSEKESVLEEIEKYIELYRKIENINSMTFDEIEKLDKDLKEAIKRAGDQARITNSTNVHKVCKDLVSSKLDEKVTKLKNEVGANEYKKLRANFEEMVTTEIDKCKEDYKSEIKLLKQANEISYAEKLEMKESFEERIKEICGRLHSMEDAFQKLAKANIQNPQNDRNESSDSGKNQEEPNN